jgi:hypothetical protein
LTNKWGEYLESLPPNLRWLTQFYGKRIVREHLEANIEEYKKEANHLEWCVHYYEGQLHNAQLNHQRNSEALEELKALSQQQAETQTKLG